MNQHHHLPLIMASEANFSIFSLISITLLISLVSNPELAESSSFDFFKQIRGCHKGDKLKGIHQLKNYLHRFGYLSSKNNSFNDDFDDDLEAAVKTYQLNYHLNVTGTLDSETVSTMETPRCGVADITNGATRMESGKSPHRHSHGSNPNFHTVAHYSFFPGNLKWRPTKYFLTYGFLAGTPTLAMDAVASAFDTWGANTHFTFIGVPDYRTADLKIGFRWGDHGDGASFDGPGGILAHAFAPEDGTFHADGAERWSVGALAGYFDLETVALHEIGHLLGLHHSSVEDAIMYPSVAAGTSKGLHSDDIEGIRVVYNM